MRKYWGCVTILEDGTFEVKDYKGQGSSYAAHVTGYEVPEKVLEVVSILTLAPYGLTLDGGSYQYINSFYIATRDITRKRKGAKPQVESDI